MAEDTKKKKKALDQDSAITLTSLNQVPNEDLAELSMLTLPEVEKLKEEVATILPAGNLPGMILMGLTNVKSRKVSPQKVEQDLNTLFQGSTLLSESLYSLFVAGPAVVLAAYQRLLELSGKDVEAAFPEGTWQFYLQFGLREDTGRHTNETDAYHKERPDTATVVDDIASWIVTAMYQLFDTYALTATLWQEWTTLRLLKEAAERHDLHKQSPFNSMIRDWVEARPYTVKAGQSYAQQRLSAFESFSTKFYTKLPTSELGQVSENTQKRATEEQPAYQKQMNLLARLVPEKFMDDKSQIPLWDAKIGLIWKGRIYLIDACAKDKKGRPLAFTETGERWPLAFNKLGQPLDRRGQPLQAQGGWLLRKEPGSIQPTPIGYMAPADPATVKGIVKAIIEDEIIASDDIVDKRLVQMPRMEQERLRGMLPKETQKEIKELAKAPIIINWDEQDRGLALGEVRRKARRGVGDHPLTILRTDRTVLFDQSHIFFDGIWGMVLAEVMTNQAISWVNKIVAMQPRKVEPLKPLKLQASDEFVQETEKLRDSAEYAFYEVNAETSSVDMRLVQRARGYLKKRGIRLTINDMLVFSRVVHASNYRPNEFVLKEVKQLPGELRTQVAKSLRESSGFNPAMLIPMDASFVQPKERIFPTTFRNPMDGVLDAYKKAISALETHKQKPTAESFKQLDAARRSLFAHLNAFGEVLQAIKDIAMKGESFNTATIRLIGNLPTSMQYVLDQIPQRIGPLNEVIKGEEVFSNVGRVAKDSSLTRFLSAKDDGRAKKFVWGILTDDTDKMTVTLRDFRPHVSLLVRSGNEQLAKKLADDYLLTYVAEMNQLSLYLTDFALADEKMKQ